MKYTPKSLYRVHRVAWGVYKRVWRGGFSPIQDSQEPDMLTQVKIGIQFQDNYSSRLYIPRRLVIRKKLGKK